MVPAKKGFRLLLLPVLLGVLLWSAQRERVNRTSYILRNHAHMESNAIADDHIRMQESQGYPTSTVLRTTWFPLHSSRGICAPASSVRADGSVTTWVDACGDTKQATLPPLDQDKLAGLFTALRGLPPMQYPLDQSYSVILTFCIDGSCSTRVYDRTNLPVEVERIYAMTGAPLEVAKPLPQHN